MNPSSQEKPNEETQDVRSKPIKEKLGPSIQSIFSNNEEEIKQNTSQYEKIISKRAEPDGTTSFLVKYRGKSYHHVEWISQNILQKEPNFSDLVSQYSTVNPDNTNLQTPFDPEYLNIEKLITVKQENDGTKMYLTKWCHLDYGNLTWEPESAIPQNILSDFHKSNQTPEFKENFFKGKSDYSTWKPLDVPEFTPKKYQMEGLKYITDSFCNEKNVVLGDEIGLDSCLQCSMFLKWLTMNEIKGPFLVISSEERIESWKMSLEKVHFGPFLSFLGPKIQLDTISEFELFYPGTRITKPNLILTDFSSIGQNDAILSSLSWESIFLDIGHFDTSNMESEEEMKKCLSDDFFNLLFKFESTFTVLISQMPISDPNLLKNAFCLLFKNLAINAIDFTQKLDESTKTIIFESSLRSILLKRAFHEIENESHPITEYIIDCGLSEIQLNYLQSVYQKYISYIVNKSNGYLIKSIFEDLNLICTHPYLHKGAEAAILTSRKFSDLSNENVKTPSDFSNRSLIDCSSKMKFIHKIVEYIKENNDRLLIFSHYDDILDIVQEYFEYSDISFCRLNENVRGDERNNIIQEFNASNSVYFSLLICLESGTTAIKLHNVNNAVLIDSGWNPIKDIESILNITDSNRLIIYRLLPSRTTERLKYDRALLKLQHPNSSILNSNMEIVSLLGFGIDLHDTVEYEKDSIEEILERSTRNYYEINNNFGPLSSTNPFLSSVDERINNRWSGISSYVVKEDSICPTFPAQFVNSRFLQSSTVFWTKENLEKLFEGFLRFGWGRWASILNHYKEYLDGALDFEIAAICHILLNILLQTTKSSFPIARSLLSQPLSANAMKYEEKFRKENSNLNTDFIIKDFNEKLETIEFMYFINVIVMTCPNPPSEIVVPNIEMAIDEKWDSNADRLLVYQVYNNGYMHFYESQIDPPYLKLRLKQIVHILKEKYLLYRELKNHIAHFEHFTLVRAVNMITPEEQEKYIHYLIYYGWTNEDDFKSVTESYRTPKELFIIHRIITGFCQGRKEMIKDLAESIPPHIASLILSREILLNNVRQNLNKENVAKNDWPIIDHVKKNGFFDIENCDEIRSRFGENLTTLEHQVSKFLMQYFPNIQFPNATKISFVHKSRSTKSKPELLAASFKPDHQTKPKVASQFKVECDKDGNPIMPIQLTPSLLIVNLGEIVTDRPNFFNTRYIYPKNFVSEKSFRSTIDPNDRAWYRNRVLDDGTDSPLFRVELKDNPSVYFEGRAPSKPWLELFKVINDRKKEMGLPISKIISVSGPEYFGFASPVVQALIRNLKGAEICLNYQSSKDLSSMPSIAEISFSQEKDHANFHDNGEQETEAGSEANQPEPVENIEENEDDDTNNKLTISTRTRDKKVCYAEEDEEDAEEDASDNNKENDGDFKVEDEGAHQDEEDETESFEDSEDEEVSIPADGFIKNLKKKSNQKKNPVHIINNNSNYNIVINNGGLGNFANNSNNNFNSDQDDSEHCIIC